MTNPYNLYRGVNSRKELNLRDELHRLLYGAADEVAKGKIGLLRRMRKDTNGKLMRCPCRNELTEEPSRDFFCRYCHGHGYFWDEYKIVYYRNDDSFRKREGNIEEFEGDYFYFEYNVNIEPTDFIVEVKLDKEGIPVQPVTRDKVFNIISADTFRADNGRVEFWEIRAKEEPKWSVWYGVNHRQYS